MVIQAHIYGVVVVVSNGKLNKVGSGMVSKIKVRIMSYIKPVNTSMQKQESDT